MIYQSLLMVKRAGMIWNPSLTDQGMGSVEPDKDITQCVLRYSSPTHLSHPLFLFFPDLLHHSIFLHPAPQVVHHLRAQVLLALLLHGNQARHGLLFSQLASTSGFRKMAPLPFKPPIAWIDDQAKLPESKHQCFDFTWLDALVSTLCWYCRLCTALLWASILTQGAFKARRSYMSTWGARITLGFKLPH